MSNHRRQLEGLPVDIVSHQHDTSLKSRDIKIKSITVVDQKLKKCQTINNKIKKSIELSKSCNIKKDKKSNENDFIQEFE